MAQPPFRIGVDVGGTFTDLVLADAAGAVRAWKSPSVPSDPGQGVIDAITLAAADLGLGEADFLASASLFVHGSTVATNTLLERKGARVGLLTTEGFRDALELRRGIREDVWDHRTPYPEVLVPRYLRLPVAERMSATGAPLRPLSRASLEAAVATFREEGVEAVAICFLHAYRNPAHEREAREILAELAPELWVTCSHEVAPVIGEYERASTAVVNAFVAPRVTPYLTSLDARLKSMGLPTDLLLVQSNGGAISVAEIGAKPVQLILSGPAAGVGSLRFFGRDTGSDSLIAIEVGGTSCDVTLMQDGQVGMTDQLDVDGQALAIPAVEIHTVGAGGGTIARVDAAGLMRAGPEGAGARPGPACYGFGGDRPTVTDAQLVLGRLKPGPYAGGAIDLDLARAEAAIRVHLAEPLGISLHDAAAGILRLVEQNILHAVERVSIERGYNPRRFTLVACGGAGPLHGAPAARLLGCQSLYVPRLAGVFCAFGMCNADIRHDHPRAWLHELDDPDNASPAQLEAAFAASEADAAAILTREGFTGPAARFERGYDLRYEGQQWTVPVDCAATDPAEIRAAFEAVYQRLYGYVQPQGRIEIVNLRVAGIGSLPPLELTPADALSTAPSPIASRPVWIDAATGFAETPVYDGTVLRPGQSLTGPAVIEEATTTILVQRGDRLRVTDADNYLIEIAPETAS